MEKEKQYCVYGHFYNDVIFYIGSGSYYRDGILKSRAYDFGNRNRSKEWFEFCNNEIDKVKVRIFIRTNNRQEAYDFEEELTRRYFDHKAPLVNKDIGKRHSEEWKKQHSIAMSGENNPWYGKNHSTETREKMSLAQIGKILSAEHKRKIGEAQKGKKHSEETKKKMSETRKGRVGTASKKVLITNNNNGESKVFDSIKDAHEFISQNGFDKSKSTLQRYLKNGQYNLRGYIIELA